MSDVPALTHYEQYYFYKCIKCRPCVVCSKALIEYYRTCHQPRKMAPTQAVIGKSFDDTRCHLRGKQWQPASNAASQHCLQAEPEKSGSNSTWPGLPHLETMTTGSRDLLSNQRIVSSVKTYNNPHHHYELSEAELCIYASVSWAIISSDNGLSPVMFAAKPLCKPMLVYC